MYDVTSCLVACSHVPSGWGSLSLVPCCFQGVSVWVSLTETPPGQRTTDTDPLDRGLPGQRPPGRDPLDRDPQTETHWTESPQTETSWTKNPLLDRDPPVR